MFEKIRDNDTKKVARDDLKAKLIKSGMPKYKIAACLMAFDEVSKNYSFSRKVNSCK